MTKEEWFSNPKTIEKSKRYYAHFDCRTDIEKVRERVTDPEWVSHHGFYPFIHYQQNCTKFNKNKGRSPKKRDICYAAHIDRCILQYYSFILNERYNQKIRELQMERIPVAYRSNLGLNNIQLAKEAFDFIKEFPNAFVMIGDFTSFFDRLNHQYLKVQWCKLLGVKQLPEDHYAIFKNITKYSFWELNDLLKLNGLSENGSGKRVLNAMDTVLTKEQYRKNRSHINKHTDGFGIPQGSPISGILANVYMMDVDQQIKGLIDQHAGKYMRYSDDFIIILPVTTAIAKKVIESINCIIHDTPGLELKPEKTQIYKVNLPVVRNVGEKFLKEADTMKNVISFLGFTFDGKKITLRGKTVSKYYYRMYRKAHTVSERPSQKAKKALYEKYSERGAYIDGKHKGNFLTYVNRAERIFGAEEEVKRPVKKHMAKIRKALGRRN